MKREVLFRVASRLASKYTYPIPGPWDDEDDEYKWTTRFGLKGLLWRNSLGTWCVYVEVPEGNPGYERSHESLKDIAVGNRKFEEINFSGRLSGMRWAFGVSFDHFGHLLPTSSDNDADSVYVTQEEAKELGEKLALIISELTEDSFKERDPYEDD